jgi:hypothetical protein
VFKIAIQPDVLSNQSFSERWVARLTELGHDVQLVSVRDPDFLERVKACDGFLWWFPPLPYPRELGKRLLPALDHATSVHATNVFVHPDWRSCWHFDDKVAQTYLLQAVGIPMPRTWVLWRYDEAIEFCRTAQYPLVIKLSSGFRSENVGLLRDRPEAERMARRFFGAGVSALHPRRFESLRAATRPFRNWLQLRRGRAPLSPPVVHRNHMLVQEFVAGNDFDTRVTIIGDRAFSWRRGNRPNDFRASGGGFNDYDPGKIDRDALLLAFQAAQTLRMPSVCFDILRRGGSPVITELSYFYESHLVAACPGHWRKRDGELEWVEGSMRAEDAVLDDFLARLTSFRNKS